LLCVFVKIGKDQRIPSDFAPRDQALKDFKRG